MEKYNYQKEAEKILHLMRLYPSDYDSNIVRFLSVIDTGKLNFEDVGTSQSELELLRDLTDIVVPGLAMTG